MRTERRLDASMKIGGATVVFAVEGFELTKSLLVAIARGIQLSKIRATGEMPEWGISFEMMSLAEKCVSVCLYSRESVQSNNHFQFLANECWEK